MEAGESYHQEEDVIMEASIKVIEELSNVSGREWPLPFECYIPMHFHHATQCPSDNWMQVCFPYILKMGF